MVISQNDVGNQTIFHHLDRFGARCGAGDLVPLDSKQSRDRPGDTWVILNVQHFELLHRSAGLVLHRTSSFPQHWTCILLTGPLNSRRREVFRPEETNRWGPSNRKPYGVSRSLMG